MMSLIDFKNEFKDREGIHFNNAGMAPIPRVVADRVTSSIFKIQREGAFVDSVWVPEVKATRERLAHYLDADPSEVAFTSNCAHAVSQSALGFPLKSGDSVVTVDQEYSTNYYPWKVACDRAGAQLIVVQSEPDKQVSMEKLIAAIKPGVKMVGISWVQFQTGAIVDLKVLGDHCHSVGAFLMVDAIQGLGQLQFSFRDLPVDFVSGGSQKWMCSINGQGFLAVKKELLAILNPLAVGSSNFNRFGTFADPDAPMETSARKFEAGGLGFFPLFALDSAIKLQTDIGMDVIEAEVTRLSQILRQGLLAVPNLELVTPLKQLGGTTSFKLGLQAEVKFLKRCREEQVAVAKRSEFIRLSLHAFCTETEIETVLGLLR